MINICPFFADINENAVTITGDSTAFFDLRVSSNPLEMEERIIFSFRTQVYKALIFYMYDELNNFIQLEVVEGKKLRFTRNNFQQIFHQDIEVPGLFLNESVPDLVSFCQCIVLIILKGFHVCGKARYIAFLLALVSKLILSLLSRVLDLYIGVPKFKPQ